MNHSTSSYQLSEQDAIIRNLRPENAIEIIMDTYGDEIKRLVYTYVKNTADTDDVAQEVFVAAYQNLHTFQGRSSLKSWLYSIAINKSKDYLRSWHVRNRNLTERLREAFQFKSNTTASPEKDVLKQSESNELINKIMKMPIKYREVIILYYFKDFSTKEISEMLQANNATIRTRLFRARKQLKDILRTERGEEIGS